MQIGPIGKNFALWGYKKSLPVGKKKKDPEAKISTLFQGVGRGRGELLSSIHLNEG